MLHSNKHDNDAQSLKTEIIVHEVCTSQDASSIAPLYIAYYQRLPLTQEMFLEKWHQARKAGN